MSGWFDAWARQHLAVCLTVADTPNVARLLATFGVEGTERSLTLEQADDLVDEPVIRVCGGTAGYCCVIEHFTVIGTRDSVQEELHRSCQNSIVLAANVDLSLIVVWGGGEKLDGLVLGQPSIRYGSPARPLEVDFRRHGLLDGSAVPELSRCLQLIQARTGFELTEEILEGSHPAGVSTYRY